MSGDWNFLQELVFNFGAELNSNPTQYMMERAFEEAGLNWRYVQFEFGPEKLADAVAAMRTLGFRGGNCTIPYKVEIAKHLDRLGESARLMGAVNCVVRCGEELVGENTDGKGFLRSFAEQASPKGKSFVLLGAGGAARAIGVELALAEARAITVVNRDVQRGRDLVEILTNHTSVSADFVEWKGNYAIAPDVDAVVNATSIGMGDRDAQVPVEVATLRSELIVADVIVDPPETWLVRTARDLGCTAIDGLGMVVNQALIAFEMWTGVAADAATMRAAIDEVLG